MNNVEGEEVLQQQIRWALDTLEYFCQYWKFTLEIDPASDPYGQKVEGGVRRFVLKFTIMINGDSLRQQYFCLIENTPQELCAKIRLVQQMLR